MPAETAVERTEFEDHFVVKLVLVKSDYVAMSGRQIEDLALGQALIGAALMPDEKFQQHPRDAFGRAFQCMIENGMRRPFDVDDLVVDESTDPEPPKGEPPGDPWAVRM